MQDTSTRFLVAAVVIAATACASSQHPEAGADVAEVPAAPFPRLIWCPNDVVVQNDASDPPAVQVGVQVLVGVDGRVLQVAPPTATSDTEYSDEARGMASMCRFRPAMQDGEPIAAWHIAFIQLRPR
jgi:hypothetical protein